MPARSSTRKSPATRARKSVMDPKRMVAHAEEAADFLKALANDQRLAILCTLLEGPMAVGQINERVELSQSALSQHLAVLRDSNLVNTEKQSQTVYYSLHDDKTRRLLELLHDCFCNS